jgi:hypothetical protein
VNGDFSGEVKVTASIGALQYERTKKRNVFPHEVVSIPFEVMKELVGRYVSGQLVDRIESLSGAEIIDRVET